MPMTGDTIVMVWSEIHRNGTLAIPNPRSTLKEIYGKVIPYFLIDTHFFKVYI